MASIVELSVDAAVYEHASIMWENLVGSTPEKVVYRLSAGEGLVSEVDRLLVDDLNDFLHRVDRFVPRVRLNVPGGDIYSVQCNTLIARWRRRLSSVRSGMLRSNKPVYITDAVNAIITKPYNDEIARLRKSISAEQELQKSGQELTPEQQQRVVEVNAKIEEQKSKLRKLPRCNNIILTAMLHEVIDRMPQEERDELTRLEQERSRNRKEIENVIAELKDVRLSLGSNSKYAGEGEKESLEKRLPELEEKCMIMDADYDANKQRRAEILQKYYDHIKPEVVAEALMEAPYTFWESFNMNKSMKEVNVRVASATKSSRRTKSGDEEKPSPKRKRKQPTIEEHAADLMLFPFSFGDADTGDIRSLLVEDNIINREITLELLSMTNASVDTAEDGSKAVEAFESAGEGYYDLILMDIQMPVMDGYVAARAIRSSKRADAGSVRIIAMTANTFAEDVARARDAGMDGHLAKPIDIPLLMQVLRQIL